ncbi:MAG: ankyrin repeat domain-containing protein [Candidatus Hydrogenedentes bacterium]|nr:ankyrin repeat domain-containing protein [Candidatus Hydrogenedentota bacterium]
MIPFTPRTTRGFSILELIAVLAVLLVLMLLAWPSIQVRRSAVLGEDLRQAMFRKDRDAALRYLSLGAPPDAWSGASPHFCIYCESVKKGDQELLRGAVTSVGIDNTSIRFHCPPLLVIALERHDTAMVDLLLELGAPVTQRLQCREDIYPERYVRLSPLAAAIEVNDSAMVNLLLAHTTPQDLQEPGHPSGSLDNDSTLLHSAVRSGNPEWLKLLLERGVPVDALERLGETALHEAARRGNKKMIAILLAHGADPRARDNSGAVPLDKAPLLLRGEMATLLGAARLPERPD